MKWFAQFRPARFFMKIDDDAFADLDGLIAVLENQTSKYVYMGLIQTCAPVERSGKNAEQPDVFEGEFFPPYALGGAYILNADLVHEVVQAASPQHSQFLKFFNEDVAVGVLIAETLMPRIPVHRVMLSATEPGCSKGKLLALGLSLGQLPCMAVTGTCCNHLFTYHHEMR